MICLSLDTCVLLGLIGAGSEEEYNSFNELCFWIENKHLILITPENIIREWNRHKIEEIERLVDAEKKFHKNVSKPYVYSGSEKMTSFQEDKSKEFFQKRVERLDTILNAISEQVRENQEILNEAARRSLHCLPPAHSKDSFRDSVNICTVFAYLKEKMYPLCYFATANYKDFSISGSSRYDVHEKLAPEFEALNLKYIFVEDEQPFGSTLVGRLLSWHKDVLPSFLEYLKAKKAAEKTKELESKKETPPTRIENADQDFIENMQYIDNILSKPNRTNFDEETLERLIKRHPSYEQYFLRKVGNNGLV